MDEDVEYIRKCLPDILPSGLLDICLRYLRVYPDMSEIRIRKGMRISFTVSDANIDTGYVCDEATFDMCLARWIGDSKYKYADSILHGVIPLSHGFRVGIAGKALIDDGNIKNIYDLTSLTVRLPRRYKGCSGDIYEHLIRLPKYKRSLLIASPPCGGKTTILRDLAYKLSTPPVSERVCVVDTRCELVFSDSVGTHMDVFKGYPIEMGIEIATKYFNPQCIVCDEIGSQREVRSILDAANSGVPLIATVHSPSLSDLVLKNNIRTLLEKSVFYNVAILRLGNKKMSITIHGSDDIKGALEDI